MCADPRVTLEALSTLKQCSSIVFLGGSQFVRAILTSCYRSFTAFYWLSPTNLYCFTI